MVGGGSTPCRSNGRRTRVGRQKREADLAELVHGPSSSTVSPVESLLNRVNRRQRKNELSVLKWFDHPRCGSGSKARRVFLGRDRPPVDCRRLGDVPNSGLRRG